MTVTTPSIRRGSRSAISPVLRFAEQLWVDFVNLLKPMNYQGDLSAFLYLTPLSERQGRHVLPFAMSETQSSPAKSTLLQLSSSDAYQRWRLLKDRLVAHAVVVGGLGIIFAIVLIFFYLLYVVFPLLLPAHAEAVSQYDAPEPALGGTVFLSMEEQNEVGVRFTDAGKAIFFAVADGRVIKTDDLPVPAAFRWSAMPMAAWTRGDRLWFVRWPRWWSSRLQAVLSGGKRLITPSALSYPMGAEPIVDGNEQALSKITVKGGRRSKQFSKPRTTACCWCRSVKESMFDDEVNWERTEAMLDMIGTMSISMLLDKELRNLYVAAAGDLAVVDISGKASPSSSTNSLCCSTACKSPAWSF